MFNQSLRQRYEVAHKAEMEQRGRAVAALNDVIDCKNMIRRRNGF